MSMLTDPKSISVNFIESESPKLVETERENRLANLLVDPETPASDILQANI